jgi:glutathione S-transferase
MLTLFFAPGSSSMAPHIALHEIGVPFEAQPVSFAKKENRSPGYLRLNPEGKVPTLLVDGRPLTEVAAILFYLAKRFPAAGLLRANDIEAEARAISWMSFIAATLHPARARGLDRARGAYALADKRLGEQPWAEQPWAMGAYSIVDIHLFRLYWRFYNSLRPSPSEFPNLDAHYQSMLARPAVCKTCAIEAAIGYELPA